MSVLNGALGFNVVTARSASMPMAMKWEYRDLLPLSELMSALSEIL